MATLCLSCTCKRLTSDRSRGPRHSIFLTSFPSSSSSSSSSSSPSPPPFYYSFFSFVFLSPPPPLPAMFLFLAFFGAFTSPLVFALNSQMISNAANSFLNKKNSFLFFFFVYNLSVWRFCLSVNLFRLFLMKPVLLHSLALIRLSRRFLLL